MSKTVVCYDVVSCNGMTDIDDIQTRPCCPFYDEENESEYCPLNEFFLENPMIIPNDCILKTHDIVIRTVPN